MSYELSIMNQQIKQCQNCKQKFTIEPEDFDFYEKVKVPAPTFCPECRFQRRITWRNERSLYKRRCDLCNELIVSIYTPDSPSRVYCQNCWWSDKWDPLHHGQKYDFNLSFFEQFHKLVLSTPQMALINKHAVNSPYCHSTVGNKNCYLIFGGDYNENCMYSGMNFYTKDSSDLYWVFKSEQSYELIDSRNCFNVSFGQYCENCFDSQFLYDCRNCNNCFGCVGLRNKSYYIFNKQYTKDEYQQKIKGLDSGSYINIKQYTQKLQDLIMRHPHRYALIEHSTNCIGNNILNSRNCHHCFDAENDLEDIRFLWLAFDGPKDVNSICHMSGASSLCYDSCSIVQSSQIFFSKKIWNLSREIFYSYNCHNSSNLFGCTCLRNKQYCILNKQYSKEEYEKLVPKIIQHMNSMSYTDKKGRVYKYGEFFPAELSPFAYNETVAQEYFPLIKEQVIQQGYAWKDSEKKDYEITIKPQGLLDHIKDVKDNILDKVIGCEHHGECSEQCSTAFKIIASELQFYRKMNLPLPRLCPNCRHYQRVRQRNPLKLWHRKCQCAGEQSDNKVYQNTTKHFHGTNHCPNEFETTYASDCPEIVYCKKCYLKEVV